MVNLIVFGMAIVFALIGSKQRLLKGVDNSAERGVFRIYCALGRGFPRGLSLRVQ